MHKQFQAKDLLAANGFRVTFARTAVINFLKKADKPVDVSEIETNLKYSKITVDQVTIYRMLEAFVKKDIVARVDFHDGKFRYELVSTDHHHVICEKCGIVGDVEGCSLEEMEKIIARKQKFLIKRHALEFFGLCPKCQ